MEEMFTGFSEPKENWSKLPHEFINALPIISSESELKVILYILRHTWGYGDGEKRITLDEFSNGRKRKNGTRIDRGTGQSINAIRDGLKRAEEHGFIKSEKDESDKARIKTCYWLAMSTSGGGVSEVDSHPPEVARRQSKVDTRSEKETLERNLEKDIFPLSAEKPESQKPKDKNQDTDYRARLLKAASAFTGDERTAAVADPHRRESKLKQHIAESILAVLFQAPVELKRVASSMRGTTQHIATETCKDLNNQVYTIQDFEDAVAHFLNGGYSEIEDDLNKTDKDDKAIWKVKRYLDAHITLSRKEKEQHANAEQDRLRAETERRDNLRAEFIAQGATPADFERWWASPEGMLVSS